jgi:hypothetical protein
LQVNVVPFTVTVSFNSDFEQELPTFACFELELEAKAVPVVRARPPTAIPAVKIAAANRFLDEILIFPPISFWREGLTLRRIMERPR